MINRSALAADHNVIIGFHQSDIQSNEKLVHDNGGKVKKTFHLISAISANMSDENITKLKKTPGVANIENDSIYQVADEYTSSWGVLHIGSQPVHNQSINGSRVKIAVLDTGIDYNHEEFKNNYKGGFDIINNDSDPWDDNCLSNFKTCHRTHIEWAVADNMNIIYMSLGSTENNTAVLDAINAAYDSVIAVSATDSNDQIASFSAIGSKIELSALE